MINIARIKSKDLFFLFLLAFPLIMGLFELVTAVSANKFNIYILMSGIMLLPLAIPIFSLKKLINKTASLNANRINKIRYVIFLYLLVELVLRFSFSGNFESVFLDLISPRGEKSWQFGSSDINVGNFSLINYSGLFFPAIGAIYISLSLCKHKLNYVDIAILSITFILTLTDYSRLQFLVSALSCIVYIKSKKVLGLGFLLVVSISILQGSIRGDAIGAYERDSLTGFEIHSVDKSYLGWYELLSNAKYFGSIVDTEKIIQITLTYYVPRFLWSEKPVPVESDWSGFKYLWTAAGTFVELSLMFGIIPAIFVQFSFYVTVYFLLAIRYRNVAQGIFYKVAIILVLLWAPRSLQSFIQFSPIFIFVYLLVQFSRVSIGSSLPYSKKMLTHASSLGEEHEN
jgi:hypothetical protein